MPIASNNMQDNSRRGLERQKNTCYLWFFNDYGLSNKVRDTYCSFGSSFKDRALIVQIWARSGFEGIEEFLRRLLGCQVSDNMCQHNGNTMMSEAPGVSLRITSGVRGVGLRVADSHTGNHPEDNFTPLETIRRSYSVIRERIPFELERETFEPERGYVIKPPLECLKPSWEHVQQRPAIMAGENEMGFRNFIYTEDDEDLTFLPKEPSSSFGTGSPFVSVNTEPLKANEEPDILPVEVTTDSGGSPKPELFVVYLRSVAARIKDRKCKTRGSSRPPVKRKFDYGSSTFCATRAKTSFSKDDAPFLKLFDDDEGLLDVLEHKDANAFHLKISAITPPAWKSHLDNHIDLELLGLYDRCYTKQYVVDNAVNKRSHELLQVIEKLKGECDVMRSRERARDEEYEGLMMLESQKRAGYQQSLSTLESKFTSLKTEKARLEAVEVSLRKEVEELKQDRREVVSKVIPYAAMELVHSDDMGNLVGKLVSSAIVYGRCRVFELVAGMKEPFDLSKVKGYRSSYKKDHTQASNDLATATFPWLDEFAADPSTPIEALLSKKPKLSKDMVIRGLKSLWFLLKGLLHPLF
nr:hypothetical protein [Tanacetum cinerariifolium]